LYVSTINKIIFLNIFYMQSYPYSIDTKLIMFTKGCLFINIILHMLESTTFSYLFNASQGAIKYKSIHVYISKTFLFITYFVYSTNSTKSISIYIPYRFICVYSKPDPDHHSWEHSTDTVYEDIVLSLTYSSLSPSSIVFFMSFVSD